LVNAFLNKHRDKYNVKEGWEKWLLDMVAISTIADLVPLKNENRLFVKYGLQVLRKSARPGLQKILTNAKIDQKSICEDDIAYGVAPRINSASRMAEPLEAFYALLHNEESIDYANKLEKFNTNRKFDTKEAIESIDTEKLRGEEIIFLGDENWGPGILGLIATKVGETTGKTCFIWGMGEDKNIMKGSVRVGENNLNVVEIMTRGEMFLENFGGHEAAGGFAIHKDKIKGFEKFLKEYGEKIKSNKKDKKGEVEKEKDFITLNIENINKRIYEEIKIFSPFGIENNKPIFKIKINEKDIINSKRFGKNKEHLEISVNNLRGIEFFVNENREKDLLEKKEYLINIEWDNYRRDVVIKFLK
jgi:single-stranded-DNA-specific exonuclease